MAKKSRTAEKPEDAARHCLTGIPYRMVVFKRRDGCKTPLYLVAGSAEKEQGAEKALKLAHELHGGDCFYCKKTIKPGEVSIDHAQPRKTGGGQEIQNLLIACCPYNREKAAKPIELYNPDAGREWLSAVLAQVQERLNRL